MGDVRDETCLCAEFPQELLGNLRIHTLHVPALIAHQVNVHMIVNSVVRRRTVANMCVCDEPNLFKHLKIAVDRREVYSARCSLNMSQDFLRGAMSKIFDCLEHKLTLRRDAIATSTEFLVPGC